MADTSPDIKKKELERFVIELSWKSSKIEGNTYSLLETEQLLNENREAKGHTKEEATMITNHKTAFQYIRNNTNTFNTMSVKQIEEIHSLLIDNLAVSKNIRKTLVRITGTNFKPLDNQFQIKDALQEACKLTNAQSNPFEKAVVMMLLIAYIQPFVDGNKRTSRLCGNAILMVENCSPLSYRGVDELEYKKAVLLFYEQNNPIYFKQLLLYPTDTCLYSMFVFMMLNLRRFGVPKYPY